MGTTKVDRQQMIVTIEDDPSMVSLMTLILEGHGYAVAAASDGPMGLDLIREKSPDIVLLDLMMHGMSGWEVYQAMKADETMRDIPVIVVTAKAAPIDKALGNVAKVQDYIGKPFSPSELVNAIDKIL